MAPLDPSATTPTQFWAIKKCDSLKSPAIFTHWDDCSFYVDQSENDCKVEFSIFSDGMEALNYLFPTISATATTTTSNKNEPSSSNSPSKKNSPATGKKKNAKSGKNSPPPGDEATAAAGSSNLPNMPAGTTGFAVHTPNGWQYQYYPPQQQMMFPYQNANFMNPYGVPGNFNFNYPNFPYGQQGNWNAMAAGGGAATTPDTSEKKRKRRSGGSNVKKEEDDDDDDDDEGSVSQQQEPKNRDLYDNRWEERFHLFLEFKREFGDGYILRQRIDRNVDKYKSLRRWRTQQRSLVQKYLKHPHKMSSNDVGKVQRLLGAGFEYKHYAPKRLARENAGRGNDYDDDDDEESGNNNNSKSMGLPKSATLSARGGKGGGMKAKRGRPSKIPMDESPTAIKGQNSKKKNREVWEKHFQFAKMYKQAHGSLYSMNPKQEGYDRALDRWVLQQIWEVQNANTTLTKGQIRRLGKELGIQSPDTNLEAAESTDDDDDDDEKSHEEETEGSHVDEGNKKPVAVKMEETSNQSLRMDKNAATATTETPAGSSSDAANDEGSNNDAANVAADEESSLKEPNDGDGGDVPVAKVADDDESFVSAQEESAIETPNGNNTTTAQSTNTVTENTTTRGDHDNEDDISMTVNDVLNTDQISLPSPKNDNDSY